MLVGTPSYALCSPCLSKAAQSPRVAPVPLASQDTCQVLLANGKEEIIPLPPPPPAPSPQEGARSEDSKLVELSRSPAQDVCPELSWSSLGKRTVGSRAAPLSGLCRGEAQAREETDRWVLLESQLGCLETGPSQQQRRLQT